MHETHLRNCIRCKKCMKMRHFKNRKFGISLHFFISNQFISNHYWITKSISNFQYYHCGAVLYNDFIN